MTMEPIHETATELLQRIARYCRMHGAPDCYQNWSPETLYDYLAFHSNHATHAWVQTSGQIVGSAVMWQCREADILEAARTQRYFFHWQPSDPLGDALFIADVVCTAPGALGALLAKFTDRFTDWERLKVFTFRSGRLVEYPPRMLWRFCRKVEA